MKIKKYQILSETSSDELRKAVEWFCGGNGWELFGPPFMNDCYISQAIIIPAKTESIVSEFEPIDGEMKG